MKRKRKKKSRRIMTCSFCGCSEDVRKLICGPRAKARICFGCVLVVTSMWIESLR